MSSALDIPVLERPAFFYGQRLTAADLAAVQGFHRELRWLHNRSLHSWGIAFGYAVTGQRGERAVTVQPGYALDCKGRDLILGEARTLATPVVAGAKEGGPAAYYLTVSYAEDEDLTPETRQGLCDTSGAVRRPEQPLLQWKDPDDRSGDGGFRHGLDVVLASIQVENCQLAEELSGAERRDAVPAQQPYVAAGQTGAGKTPWQLWTVEQDGEDVPIGVRTTVATAEAGFLTTPRYHAHAVGRRTFDTGSGEFITPNIVDGYAHVAATTPTSFELRVALPRGQAGSFVLNPSDVVFADAFMERLRSNSADDLGWHVVWMGVEG